MNRTTDEAYNRWNVQRKEGRKLTVALELEDAKACAALAFYEVFIL
jgi:hypothetical protein